MTFPTAEYYLRSHAERNPRPAGAGLVWKPVRRRHPLVRRLRRG
ncbi:MAG TPA: hypothetical protein VFM09_00105 [Marmoricola sp.]|nr:hypothetical protein [Marmoricola sp.]